MIGQKRLQLQIGSYDYQTLPQSLLLEGESGCGKSTIGRQLVGLEIPTAGTITYQGMDLSKMKKEEMQKHRTDLQMIFQDPYSSLNPRKHIFEILAQPMLYHKISAKATVEQDILKLLDMVVMGLIFIRAVGVITSLS